MKCSQCGGSGECYQGHPTVCKNCMRKTATRNAKARYRKMKNDSHFRDIRRAAKKRYKKNHPEKVKEWYHRNLAQKQARRRARYAERKRQRKAS